MRQIWFFLCIIHIVGIKNLSKYKLSIPALWLYVMALRIMALRIMAITIDPSIMLYVKARHKIVSNIIKIGSFCINV